MARLARRNALSSRSIRRACVLALGSALVASCVGDDPDPGESAPPAPPAPTPLSDSGTTPDAGPATTADALPQESYCATHAGLFCADFDQQGPIDRGWSRSRKLGSSSFAYSDLFYVSPPRGATAHLDALPDGSATPGNSVAAQFERDLPIEGAFHLHLEAAVRIDVPSVLPPRAQFQYLAIYFGPSAIGSVSLFVDASEGWIVYVSRYAHVETDSGTVSNDHTIPLKEKFPTARMVPVKLDVYLGTPAHVRFEVGGVVTEQDSVALTEIVARNPTTWTAKVGPLQARGDTPATDLTADNVLVAKE